MRKIAIVGGGPGGLIAAYLLERKSPEELDIALFEASDRLGGKIVSRTFDTVPARYEAGVAELYDYSANGFDPLRKLVDALGLTVLPMSGEVIAFGDRLLQGDRDLKEYFGKQTFAQIEAFHDRISSLLTPVEFAQPTGPQNNSCLWAGRSFQAVLDEIPDLAAQQYFKILARSDLATEPHLTDGLYGLENICVSDPDYLKLYTLAGGIERLPQALAAQIAARIYRQSPVVRLEKTQRQTYRLFYRQAGKMEAQEFDSAIVALPFYWLPAIQWGGEPLAAAMQQHHAYYDRPAHYLRITLLFQKPFWREAIADSYWTSDAFGGCCIYDETSRYDAGEYGVLSWLLAGNDALVLSNDSDRYLTEQALAALPRDLAAGRELFLESRVNRWVGAVNALPGGRPIQSWEQRHIPEPHHHPGLFVVGDYLFDSTLNGVTHSARFSTDAVLKYLGLKPRSSDLNPALAPTESAIA